MTTVSTSFASSAFKVVDRTCAVGNLSYAHEVGHNQGLQHDPANARQHAVGSVCLRVPGPVGPLPHRDVVRLRTRIPFLSSPACFYNGRPTGTSARTSPRAERQHRHSRSVQARRRQRERRPPTTDCTYSVSTTSLSFSARAAPSRSRHGPVRLRLDHGQRCGGTWVALNTAGGTGSGSVTVSATANTGPARSTTVTMAGKSVAVSESAPSTKGKPRRRRRRPQVSGSGRRAEQTDMAKAMRPELLRSARPFMSTGPQSSRCGRRRRRPSGTRPPTPSPVPGTRCPAPGYP